MLNRSQITPVIMPYTGCHTAIKFGWITWQMKDFAGPTSLLPEGVGRQVNRCCSIFFYCSYV